MRHCTPSVENCFLLEFTLSAHLTCLGHQRWLLSPSKQLLQAISFFYKRTSLLLASLFPELESSSSVMALREVIGGDYNSSYV